MNWVKSLLAALGVVRDVVPVVADAVREMNKPARRQVDRPRKLDEDEQYGGKP